jgi:L-lactate utilization protein LutB
MICKKEKEIQELRDMVIENRTDFKYIKESIKDIKNNHLAHMQVALEGMEKQIDTNSDEFKSFKYKALAWSSIGALLGSLLIQLAFKYL